MIVGCLTTVVDTQRYVYLPADKKTLTFRHDTSKTIEQNMHREIHERYDLTEHFEQYTVTMYYLTLLQDVCRARGASENLHIGAAAEPLPPSQTRGCGANSTLEQPSPRRSFKY